MDAAPLKGRVALVTGAGRNIGRAIALGLADAGAQVAVNVRASRHEGQAVVDDIVARGGDALLVLADVTERTQVDAMIAAITQRFGRLDIVVNNAAMPDGFEIDTAQAPMLFAVHHRRSTEGVGWHSRGNERR